MPDNDAMRKVNPGDPLVIPAGAYNRFIDTAVASERGGLVPSAGKRGPSQLAAGVVYGQNGAGVSATAGAAVTITGVLSAGLATFGVPSAEPYGILLDAAAAGGLARVATTGGPWQVLVHEAIVASDRLEPVASGYAEITDGGPLLALSGAAGGLCWVVFASGGGARELLTYEVRAVGSTTLTARVAPDLAADSEVDYVAFVPGSGPVVGDWGLVVYDSDGGPHWLPTKARLLVDASDLASAPYLKSKLTAGTHIALTVTNVRGNEQLQIGETGTRADQTQPLVVEVRTSDPVSPPVGSIWLRSDL